MFHIFCGIIWGLCFSKIGIIPIFLLIIIGIIKYLSLKAKHENKNELKKNIILFIIVIMMVFLGFINYSIRYEKYEKTISPGGIQTSGIIQMRISEGEYYNKYIFKDKDGQKYQIYIPNAISINENDIISINGEYEKPSHARNKGAFDYANYLYSQNIYGSIYIKNSNNIEIIGYSFNLISIIRNSMFNVFEKLFSKEHMGLINGMIIGDTNYISDETKDSFRLSRNITSSCSITEVMLHTLY